ncbi:MAG: AMP-binding protein [Acidimicrobiales bacterium]
MEHNWATLWEHLTDAVPDAPAVVQGHRRRTWAELDDRGARLAAVLGDAGVGPGARVAQYLYNAVEYIETYVGTVKARAVPVNVNYRYVDDELAYLLNDSGAEALVYHASLADRVARAAPRAGALRLLLEVDDAEAGADVSRPGVAVPGAVAYDDALAAVEPAPRLRRSPDDTTILYTGGTTGMPKGVVSRVGPHVGGLKAAVAPLLGVEPTIAIDEIPAVAARAVADGAQIRSLPACPLMHGTGMGIGVLPPMTYGGCIVLLPDRHFDADELWATVEREQATWTVIVGDPFARPMLQSLRRAVEAGRPFETSSLRILGSSGAMFSYEVRQGLLDLPPRR